MKIISITLLLGCILFSAQIAYCEKGNITWLHADTIKLIDNDERAQVKSYAEYMEYYLASKLPEYSHFSHVANYSRIQKHMKNGNACCTYMVKNEHRKNYVLFSVPVAYVMSPHLCISNEKLYKIKKFVKKGKVKLGELLKKTNLKFGVSKGVSYTEDLDIIIHGNHQYEFYTNDILEGLTMLQSKGSSIDFILGYPDEIEYIVLLGKVKDNFTLVPIHEVSSITSIHVGCSKNKWGNDIITKINSILLANDGLKDNLRRFFPVVKKRQNLSD